MPQQIDVPGLGIVEFPDGMDDAAITSAIQKNIGAPTGTSATPDRPFLERLGSFARKVYENPPPSIAGARDIIKGAPAAARELTYGADPEAAREAAGVAGQAAAMGLGFKGPGGTNVGVAGRPIAAPGTVVMPRLPPLFPRAAAPEASATAQEAIGAAARGGYTLPTYAATEGTLTPQVASSLRNVPWGGQPIVRTHDELLANMGRHEGTGGAGTPETAGGAAKSNLTSFITTESKKPVSDAFKAVDELINPDVRAPLTNTARVAQQIEAERARARLNDSSAAVNFVSKAIKPEVDIPPELAVAVGRRNPELLQGPSLDYQGLKDLRTAHGPKVSQDLVGNTRAEIEHKRIYEALTEDLKNLLRQNSPEAFNAWQKANALTRQSKRQQEALAKVVGVKGDAAPEMVFERLATMAQAKGGADILKLRLAKQAMGADAWNGVGAALIERMGKDPAGIFSPERFVTAWGKMAGAAKQELFRGEQAAALNDLFIVSKWVKDRITRFGNPSGTARGSIIGQGITGGALFAEPVSTITAVVGARVAAEALSRPAVVRAANDVARASLTGDPVRTQRAMARLGQIAVREQLIDGAQQNIEGRQAGGPVYPGNIYEVGEKGREAFIPDAAGNLSDNAVLNTMMRLHRNQQGRQGIPVGQNGPEVIIPREPGTIVPNTVVAKGRGHYR